MEQTLTDRSLLIVEDDGEVRKTLADYFSVRGNMVFEAGDLSTAKQIILRNPLDAVILDLLLPDGEGLELFELPALPPVVVLSSLSNEETVIDSFRAGAIDYCVKPCPPSIVEARLLLRMLPKQEAVLSVMSFVMDLNARTVAYEGVPIVLTGSEFNILHFFLTHPNAFFRPDVIYEQIWQAPALKENSVKYHIYNLRQKLLQTTGKNFIYAKYGLGYAFREGTEA